MVELLAILKIDSIHNGFFSINSKKLKSRSHNTNIT